MFWIKTIISALVIAGVSELAKKYNIVAAILASLPLVSIFAMVWLYIETKDVGKVVELNHGIFWAILPSLIFFIVLPLLVKFNLNFYLALVLSSIAMCFGYSIYIVIMRKFGIQI